MKKKTFGHVALSITSNLSSSDKAKLKKLLNQNELGLVEIDKFVDQKIAARIAKQSPKSRKTTPKFLRPQCDAKTRAGGKCKATPVWDKTKDRPRNGRCRMHGGLSTGPRTAEGKARSLRNLKKSKKLAN